MTATATRHIWLDERGIAWVDDIRTKVLEIALDQIGHGWSAEEIQEQHPHLSLSQIHAALSYYHDHREQVEAQIEERRKLGDRLRSELGPTPLEQRLAAAARGT
jgi:uncharacterized protein (DUF433 family)